MIGINLPSLVNGGRDYDDCVKTYIPDFSSVALSEPSSVVTEKCFEAFQTELDTALKEATDKPATVRTALMNEALKREAAKLVLCLKNETSLVGKTSALSMLRTDYEVLHDKCSGQI